MNAGQKKVPGRPRFSQPKLANILKCGVLMAIVCVLYFLNRHYRIRPTWWSQFEFIFCLFLAAGLSSYLLYCWQARKVYRGVATVRAGWFYRDQTPFFYWLFMAFYLILDGMSLWGLYKLSLSQTIL